MALYVLEKGEMRRYTLSLKKDTAIVHPNEAVISPYLNEKRQAILDGTFAFENYRKMSMQQAHALCYPQDSKSKRRCRCLKE